MNSRKLIAIVLLVIALVLGTIFFLHVSYPENVLGYFKKSYYGQFGALAICIELLIAGYYLFRGNTKANFALALFGFTAILDIILDVTKFIESMVPLYGMIILGLCAIGAFYLAFSNAYNLGKISLTDALLSFVLGNCIEWFFNFS